MRAPASKRNSSAKSEGGFTLIETVIALVIMMIVGLAAAGGFAFAIRYNSTASERAASMAIAQSALEKLRALPFSDAALAAATTNTTVSDGAGRTYTLSTTVADKIVVSGKTTLKSITVVVTPVSASGLNPPDTQYYGSVRLFSERCNPLVGANIH
jgi:Tfp pilus assembly protein PilV